MIRNWTLIKVLALAAILFTACTQDELAEQGNTLPDGEYPLQIGSVSITAEASEEPWTRVGESTDGQSSVWKGDEEFYVKFEGSDEVGIYKITDAATGAVEPVKSIYWKNTQPANIIAWYAKPQLNANNWLFLGGQNNGLVYVLRATADNASHNTPVNLQFEHQLAKVRVIVKGTADVIDVEAINVPIDCDVKEGKIVNIGTIIPRNHLMFKTTYEDIGPCWEINLPPSPDYQIENFMVLTSDPISTPCDLTTPITLEAGKVHTITLTVHRKDTKTIDLSTGDYIINDDGTYYFSGTASHAIRVTGGNPNIYLEDAQISVSGGNAIDITGGNPTIHVRGEGNTVTSPDKTGIFVAENSTVTITGNGREDKLTVRGGAGSSGIGGYLSREDPAPACGNIEITSVWIEAYGSKSINFEVAPGIGGAGSASCGTITIDDATVYAYGIEAFPIGSSSAIGGGFDIREKKGSFGAITIRNNSEVYVQRGDSYSDYIGNSGSMTYPETGDIVATVDETSKVTKQN
ncbi:fimbrillin family protein [Bacteroides sp. ET71]|uniref:fimbrillin family protein n=1 Tax=Bacteroides sp. ET71 TaxID=2939421 RepID=UPI0020119A15|nr:fimbrillin family protein [Bacteroides sp. ET71]MCL1617370.1 fimbrillin family protein [Bacteroides sp. ET71]